MSDDRQQGQGQPSKRSRNRRRRGGGNKAKRPTDLWRPVPQLSSPAPIVPVPDPTALVRSLGDPPLQGQGAVAEHYLAAAIEKASQLATETVRWLAPDLLVDPDADDVA
jgi:hypothetical protein